MLVHLMEFLKMLFRNLVCLIMLCMLAYLVGGGQKLSKTQATYATGHLSF